MSAEELGDSPMVTEARDACEALADLGIELAQERLREELERRAGAVERTGALRAFELGLALACLAHDPIAIAHFERTYFTQAARALARMKLADTLTEDILGWMRFELFVRPQGALLATYSGRGDLGGWVRAIAVHEALKRARRARREVPPDEAGDLASPLPLPDAELVAMRGAYGAELTRALSDSFRSLAPQERNLLRQYFLDGLTIDMLGRLYKVHRATAARRVAAARELLVARVKQALMRELALSEAGVDQVITLSNLNQSLNQLLRATRDDTGRTEGLEPSEPGAEEP